MKQNWTILQVKGLKTPPLFLWVRGGVHGKLLHTGGLDPQTNVITSGFVIGQLARFQSACALRVQQAEKTLKPKWSEADQILLELSDISAQLARGSRAALDETVGNAARARAREQEASRQISLAARNLKMHQRLVEISNDIRSEIILATEQAESTAELLRSSFSAYGHGLLLRPVQAQNLPRIPKEDMAEKILRDHQTTWNTMQQELEGRR